MTWVGVFVVPQALVGGGAQAALGVQRAKAASMTSSGLTQTAPRACSRGNSSAKGLAGWPRGVSLLASRARVCSVKPVPTWPT